MRRTVFEGKVLNAADPARAGAVTLQVNELLEGGVLGGEDAFVAGRSPFAGNGEGFFYPPQKNALLEVEFPEGDAVEDVVVGRWVGMLFTDLDAVPAEFTSDYGNRGGVKFGSEVLVQDKAANLTALVSANLRLGLEAASHPVVRGDTQKTALEALCDANVAQWTAIETAAVGPLAPLAAPALAMKTAWTTFKATLAGALSTKVKTE